MSDKDYDYIMLYGAQSLRISLDPFAPIPSITMPSGILAIAWGDVAIDQTQSLLSLKVHIAVQASR